MSSNARIRAYARTIDVGMRKIDEVDEENKVAVYVELITRYDWKIEDVDLKYIGAVKTELGIK